MIFNSTIRPLFQVLELGHFWALWVDIEGPPLTVLCMARKGGEHQIIE